MAKVQLKIKGQEQLRVVEIEEVAFGQFKKALKVIKKVLASLQSDKSIEQLFLSLEDKKNEVEGEEAKKEDSQFVGKMAQAFMFLVEELPEQATELLSLLSGIEEDVIDNQSLTTILEVFDKIVEVNDIESLIERGKKSLALTKFKWKVGKQKNK
jgi:hypothetical protein